MSGAFSVLFTFLAYLKNERLQKWFGQRERQRKILYSVALVFFLIASIRIWTQEHQKVINDRTKIYREFVEEKTRRIDVYKKRSTVTTALYLAKNDEALFVREHNLFMFQVVHPRLVDCLNRANQWEEEKDEEQAKFMGLAVAIRQSFKDSPQLTTLIEAVTNPKLVQIIPPDPKENIVIWLKGEEAESAKFIDMEVKNPLDKLDSYLSQHLE